MNMRTTNKQLTKTLIAFILTSISFYNQLFAQIEIWSEDFTTVSTNATSDNGNTAWYTTYPAYSSFWGVKNNYFEAQGLSNEATWYSETIDISNYTNVSISLNIAENGRLESNDYIRVYYAIDNGNEILFAEKRDDFTYQHIFISGLNGNSIQVIIKAFNSDSHETYYFDDIVITGTAISNCNNQISSFPYTESFEDGIGKWKQSRNDNFNWTLNSGGTMSGETGPDVATNGNYYLYTEQSSYNDVAYIESPCFDLSNLVSPYLYFDYHMYGDEMGTLAVEVQSISNPNNWTTIWSASGNKNNTWYLAKIDLTSYAGSSIKLRIKSVATGGSKCDMAIDHLGIADHIISVNSNATLAEFQQNITGTGVTIENLSVTSCANEAYGTYSTSSGSQLNSDHGIIMSTGKATDIQQMNRSKWWSTQLNTPGNPTLDNYTTASTMDVCYIEFDVTPSGETLSFNYTFASDEYVDYVGSSFNDVFAFLISGPGISGEENIAVIPNTTTPVSINNVNQNTNSQYFVNNSYYDDPNNGGGMIEDSTAFGSIEYDGFTINLIAQKQVQSCQTYHIKWMIGDVGDRFVDSGVLIEGLFSTNISSVVSTSEVYNTCSTDPVTITYTRDGNTSNELAFTPNFSGSVIKDVDYDVIGLQNGLVKFDAGSATTQITLLAKDSYTINTLDSVIVDLTGCSGNILTTAKVHYKPIPVFANDENYLCFGETASFDPGEFVTYQWKDEVGAILSTERVFQTATKGVYSLTVTNEAGCSETSDPFTVIELEEMQVSASAQCQPIGINKTQVYVQAIGGGGNYQYKLSHLPDYMFTNDSIFLIENNSTVQIDVVSQYGCSKSIIVTTPTFTPGELADAGKQGTCILNGINAFYHILDEEGNLIASINDLGNNLGIITAEVRIDNDVNSYNGEHYMQRNYKITPQYNGQAAKIRLYFTEDERTALKRKRNGSKYDILINDVTTYQEAESNATNTSEDNNMEYTISKYDGDTPGSANETFLTSQAQSNGFKSERHYVEFTVPSFSSMYLHEQNELLPVKLINLKATVKNQKHALINWQTASEKNNKGFEVQRSIDGHNFETVGFVKGNQNSQTNSSYSFIDENLNGLFYYRLKQIDKDNSIFYSKVVKVRIEAKDELSIIAFPNKLQNQLQLSVNNAIGNQLNIAIFNAEGKIVINQVHQSEILNSQYDINVAALQSGIYFVKVSTINQSTTLKVVKN